MSDVERPDNSTSVVPDWASEDASDGIGHAEGIRPGVIVIPFLGCAMWAALLGVGYAVYNALK